MAEPEDENGPDDRLAPSAEQPGFFTVYKKGQGYYTRLGTALCVMLLIVVTALFAYQQGNAAMNAAKYPPQTARAFAAGLTGAVVLVAAVVAWRLMNKPGSVDFLIATDSEMKKVNWTSREELIGSTKVVIIFLFVIALLLFLIDVLTGSFFYQLGLIKVPPL